MQYGWNNKSKKFPAKEIQYKYDFVQGSLEKFSAQSFKSKLINKYKKNNPN